MVIDKDKSLSSASNLRHQAEKLLKLNMPETGNPQANKNTLRTLHELKVHKIELELQNAELRQSKDEVENVQEKYTDLYDFAPVGYFTRGGY